MKAPHRYLVLLAATAMVAAACGGGGTTDAGPVPERSTTTAGPGPGATTTTTGGGGGGAAGGGPVTTAPATTEVRIWLVRGELVEAVERTVVRMPRIGAESVKALLAGPTEAEARAGFSTAVPADTRFLDLAIDGDGIARVDLSRQFESGGGSLGLTLRLAQVTCTVDQFPTVKGVRFSLGGEPVSVFSGNGIVLDRPVTCASYGQVVRQPGQPAIFAGIWPFATAAELDAYARSGEQRYRDPVATAVDFAARYVGVADPVEFGFRATGPGRGEVPVGFRYGEGRTPVADPRPTFTVELRQLGPTGPSGPWTVVGAASPDIVVTSPAPLARITSPVRVTGSALVYEGTVTVEVREDGMAAGRSLGRGSVTGGGGSRDPFSGQISFRAPTRPAGAVLFTEIGAADGQSILRASVVRVGL